MKQVTKVQRWDSLVNKTTNTTNIIFTELIIVKKDEKWTGLH